MLVHVCQMHRFKFHILHFCNSKSTDYETVGTLCAFGSRFAITLICLRTFAYWYYFVFVHVMLLWYCSLLVHVWRFEHVMLFWCAILFEHVYTVFASCFSFCWLIFCVICLVILFVCSNIFILTYTHFWLWHASVSLANYPHKSHSIPGVNLSRVLMKSLRATLGFPPWYSSPLGV